MDTTGISIRRAALIGSALLVLQALTLHFLGRPTLPASGTLQIWDPATTSQQFFDWATFMHVTSGIIFYFLLWILFPRMPFWERFLIAIALEVGCEIIENTSFIITAYQQTVTGSTYRGDTIVNSLSDTLSCIVGFVIAWRISPKLALTLALTLELLLLFYVRDNLTLNIVNFTHLFPSVEAWQSSG